jgi:hypothetical protein
MTFAAPGFTATVTAGGTVNVTVASPQTELFATDVARTLTVGDAGSAAGAVNTPADVTVPLGDPPTTDQLTDTLAAPVTVAANAWELPNWTDCAAGETATEIVGALTVAED